MATGFAGGFQEIGGLKGMSSLFGSVGESPYVDDDAVHK
jgi:hypothetical protein